MKTLLFYIDHISGGGAERVMTCLANQFAAHGYRAILLTAYRMEKEYPVSDAVLRLSMREREQPEPFLKKNFSRVRAIRKCCKEYDVDLVVSFMPEPNARALLATLGLKTKNIISVRVDPKIEYQTRRNRIMATLLYPFAEGIVFQTKEAQQYFPEAMQKRSCVIWNQVSESFYHVKRVHEPKDIVAVGRLDDQKNYPLLIRAFAKIAKDFPMEQLFIYGEGTRRQYLEALIAELGLEERVLLNGYTSNISEVLRQAKLFLLSSDYEGMPNALMEAMAAGVPCIATDCPCGGPRALIEDGVNGALVPVGGVDALAEKMRFFLSHADEREALGDHAKKRAESFRPEKVFEEWEAYVKEIA